MRAFFVVLAGLGALEWLGWWLLLPIGLLATLVGGTLLWLHHEKVTDERRREEDKLRPGRPAASVALGRRPTRHLRQIPVHTNVIACQPRWFPQESARHPSRVAGRRATDVSAARYRQLEASRHSYPVSTMRRISSLASAGIPPGSRDWMFGVDPAVFWVAVAPSPTRGLPAVAG
jgi:hypothetical protein